MDTFVLPAAETLLSCLCDALGDNPNPPAQCCLRAGDIFIADIDGNTAIDKACCPGTAWVRIGSKYPSSTFPVPDSQPARGNNCFPVSYAVELTMGVARCVPNIGTVAGPSCVDWTSAATQDAHDLDAMTRALCCWGEALGKNKLWLAGVSVVTLVGDCLQREWPVTMSAPRCC